MVIDTQKFFLVTKLDFLVIFFSILPITVEPLELQKTTAPIFGVANSVLLNANGHNKDDLRSP